MAEKKIFCARCGEELTKENARVKDGNIISTTCLSCESKFFKSIEKEVGAHLALYACCLGFNIPFVPSLIPQPENKFQSLKGDKWKKYLDILDDRSPFQQKKSVSFFDGETNILKVFGKSLSEKDTARFVKWEQDQQEKETHAGTPTQRETWGIIQDFTDEDYDELDRRYINFVTSYSDTMTFTAQQKDTIISAMKARVTAEKALASGNIKGAMDAHKLADFLLASDLLREKDKGKTEDASPETFIKHLEAYGAMKNGDLLGYEELLDVLCDHLTKKGKYKYTLDAANQMELITLNTIRKNNGLDVKSELSIDEAIIDPYGEFAEEESENEREAKEYIGLTKVEIREE